MYPSLTIRSSLCIDFQHVKPGKGNTVMRTKLKNVTTGRVLDRTFQVGFKLEDVRIERRPYQYLYQDGEDYIFMNQETFEQAPIAKEAVTGINFMKEGDVVEVVTDTTDGTVLFAEMPVKPYCALRTRSLALKETPRRIQLSLQRWRPA